MYVLEYKHTRPFDGCFHRWEYLAVDKGQVYPIVFTPGHLKPEEIVQLASGATDLGFYTQLFGEFTQWEWGDACDEIPFGYMPAFWAFANEHNLPYAWRCDECGEPQTDEPMHMAGYRGNGGVGIEVEGWLCEDCVYEQEARYYERLENKAREQIRRNENDC